MRKIIWEVILYPPFWLHRSRGLKKYLHGRYLQIICYRHNVAISNSRRINSVQPGQRTRGRAARVCVFQSRVLPSLIIHENNSCRDVFLKYILRTYLPSVWIDWFLSCWSQYLLFEVVVRLNIQQHFKHFADAVSQRSRLFIMHWLLGPPETCRL